MAFSFTIENSGIPETMGRLKVVRGTFTNAGGDTGGEIATGLRRIVHMTLTHTGAAVVASAPAINETFPFESGTATIVTVDGADGIWMAIGE